MNEENRSQAFLSGLLVGGVIGSALAFWLAGRMRRDLRERGIDIGGWLGELGYLVKDRGEEFLTRAKDVVERAIEEGKEASHKARSELEERWKEEE